MINRIITVVAVFTLSITLSSQVFAGPKLTMLINQSPWFDGFAKTLAMYEEETGASICLLYTSPSPRDGLLSRMPSSA